MKKILLLLLTLSSCNSSDLYKFRLIISYIPNIQFAPLYIGIDQGFFAAEGIDLQIDYAMGADIFTLLARGKVDAGLADSDQLLIALSHKIDVVAFRQYYTSYPLSIITTNNMLNTAMSLEGKIIGVPELFGSSYLALMEFLSFYNLQGKVNIERIGYNQIAMLEKGMIDAAVTYSNNENIFLLNSNIAFTEWPIKSFSSLAGSAFVSSAKLIDKNKKIYQQFNHALKQSINFLLENPDQSLDIAMAAINAQSHQQSFLRASLLETINLYSTTGYLSPDTFRYTFDQLKKFNFIDPYSSLPLNYLQDIM